MRAVHSGSPARVLLRAGARGARALLLDLGAVLGVLCVGMAVAIPLLGLRPLVFLSGSMAPAIPAGSLALARVTPAAAIDVGDVVTVPVGETYVTHRVVEARHHGDTVVLRLRGDANPVADAAVHQVSSAPRVLVSVPRAGRVLAWLSRPPGVFLLAGYVAFLLGSLRPRRYGGDRADGPPAPDRPGRHAAGRRAAGRRAGRIRGRRTVTGVAAGAAVVAVATAPAAQAAWADPVGVSGTTIATVSPSAPTVSCGLLNVGSTTVTWTAVPAATSYRLHYGTGGATTEDVSSATTSKTFTGSTAGTFWVEAFFGSSTWVSVASNSVTYTSLVGLVGTCL